MGEVFPIIANIVMLINKAARLLAATKVRSLDVHSLDMSFPVGGSANGITSANQMAESGAWKEFDHEFELGHSSRASPDSKAAEWNSN